VVLGRSKNYTHTGVRPAVIPTIAISVSQCCHNACHKFSKLPNMSHFVAGESQCRGALGQELAGLIANCVTAGSAPRKLNLCTCTPSAVSRRINCLNQLGFCLSAFVSRSSALWLLLHRQLDNRN